MHSPPRGQGAWPRGASRTPAPRRTAAQGEAAAHIPPGLRPPRLKYSPSEGTISILHLVAVTREGRPAILVSRFEGPTAETSVQAGLWASGQLGRRPGATP